MRILFATLGTYGDLSPYLALAEELRQRGHKVTLATSEHHRSSIDSIAFVPIEPNIVLSNDDSFAKYFDYETGDVACMENILFPSYLRTFFQLKRAAQQHDVLISSKLILPAADVVAETGIPWIEAVFAPISMGWPTYPVWPYPSWVPNYHHILGKVQPLFSQLSKQMEIRAAYRRYKPQSLLKLGLFSKYLCGAQNYWDENSVITGFVYREGKWNWPQELQAFLESGAPPIIISLGSCVSNIVNAKFYEPFIEATHNLGKRLVILAGDRIAEVKAIVGNHEHVCVVSAAANESLFPYAEAVVHHGGSGTIAHVLKAGKPSIVVPFCYDQPTNSHYLEQRGVGLHLLEKDCNRASVQNGLLKICHDWSYKNNASALSKLLQQENGLMQACNIIERVASHCNNTERSISLIRRQF